MRLWFAFFLAGLTPLPGLALDVEFNGTVTASCSLSLNTPGTLALNAGGTVLGSEEGIAVPAVVLVLSIGNNDIDVAAPARISADPAGYNAAGEVIEVSYSGASGLSLISQAYTSSPTSFAAGSIPLSALTIHNRISNAAGFAPGTYTTRTVVTCS